MQDFRLVNRDFRDTKLELKFGKDDCNHLHLAGKLIDGVCMTKRS